MIHQFETPPLGPLKMKCSASDVSSFLEINKAGWFAFEVVGHCNNLVIAVV